MNTQKIWQGCIAQLKTETSEEEFTQWIKPLKAKFNGNRLTVLAHNEVVENQVRQKYLLRIRQYLKFDFKNSSIASVNLSVARPLLAPEPVRADQRPEAPKSFFSGIRRELNFSHFAVGSSNEEAFRAAQSVADQPGSRFSNPLLIYGGVGLGKTHLLHAVGNAIQKQNPSKRIRYLYTANFVSDVVGSLRQSKLQQYLEELEQCDVMLFDDIHFLSGKDKCTEEFLHLFNKFESRGVQMVFSSAEHPNGIQRLHLSLKSRFMSNLVIELKPLNMETRVSILKQWSESSVLDKPMSDVDAYYIAEHVHGDVRALSGFWARFTMLLPRENVDGLPHRPVIDRALDSGYVRRKSVTIHQIQAAITEYYGISMNLLLSSSRQAEVVRCRHMGMLLTKQLTKLPLLSIAEQFHRKDHTTVKHACTSMRKQIESDSELRLDYDEIIEKIHG